MKHLSRRIGKVLTFTNHKASTSSSSGNHDSNGSHDSSHESSSSSSLWTTLRKSSKTQPKPKTQHVLHLDCSSSTNTPTSYLLEQLTGATSSITHLQLVDLLQRPDNVRIFEALSAFVKSSQGGIREITLLEPQILASEYRRWSFKRINFLKHLEAHCRKRNIDITIQGTLVLLPAEQQELVIKASSSSSMSAFNADGQVSSHPLQDMSSSSVSSSTSSSSSSSWLSHFAQTIPNDKDITSLHIQMHDTNTNGATSQSPYIPKNPPRSSQSTSSTLKAATAAPYSGSHQRRPNYHPVQQVFQALIELLNDGPPRLWKHVQINVQFDDDDDDDISSQEHPYIGTTQLPNYARPQTEALMEVAQVYDMSLIVVWYPTTLLTAKDNTSNSNAQPSMFATPRATQSLYYYEDDDAEAATAAATRKMRLPPTVMTALIQQQQHCYTSSSSSSTSYKDQDYYAHIIGNKVVLEDATSSTICCTEHGGSSGQLIW